MSNFNQNSTSELKSNVYLIINAFNSKKKLLFVSVA